MKPLACALLLLAGCGRAPLSPEALVFARGADSQKLDPADVDDGESIKVLVNICEGLVRFKPHTTEPEPCLATGWEISPDGLTYTFPLRPGVKFHDGTPLTAETALFSFQRQLHPTLPGATFAYWSAMFNVVTNVEARGHALVFHLREPHAPLLASLCIPAASLISPNFRDQRTPIGTGPFRFVSWTPNDRIVLERNPDYWDSPPALTQLIYRVVPDNATRLIQLRTGEIHGMDGLDPNDLPVVEADSNLQLLATPGLNVAYLGFNCDKITDVNLRRAIAAAIRKSDLVTAVYRGAGTVAHNPLPPFIPGHHDDIISTPPAPSAPPAPPPATRPLTLHVMTNPRPYLPNPLRAAEMIKADCARAGIPLEIFSK